MDVFSDQGSNYPANFKLVDSRYWLRKQRAFR